ncbi:MAG: DUF4340 domain-containing protein [Anaerolineaceae bacterium]|nr:DUF4340 domain-containing protein [Anaerolineaceae bacterium]
MIRRSTWIMLAVFVVALGLLVYLQQTGNTTLIEETPTATAYPNLMAGWAPDVVTSIRLEIGSVEAVAIEKDAGGQWIFPGQSDQLVDQGQVQLILSSIDGISAMNVLPGGDEALQSYGLATPSATLTLADQAGTQYTLLIGNKTSTGSSYYVQRDSDAPVVVSSYTVDDLLTALTTELVAAPTETPQAAVTVTP